MSVYRLIVKLKQNLISNMDILITGSILKFNVFRLRNFIQIFFMQNPILEVLGFCIKIKIFQKKNVCNKFFKSLWWLIMMVFMLIMISIM